MAHASKAGATFCAAGCGNLCEYPMTAARPQSLRNTWLDTWLAGGEENRRPAGMDS
jgi:hypothetical protein